MMLFIPQPFGLYNIVSDEVASKKIPLLSVLSQDFHQIPTGSNLRSSRSEQPLQEGAQYTRTNKFKCTYIPGTLFRLKHVFLRLSL